MNHLPKLRDLSQPAWAAWIETQNMQRAISFRLSQPAWAAWIETRSKSGLVVFPPRRSPLGLRELKHIAVSCALGLVLSQPAWAAWIETQGARENPLSIIVAALLGCVNWNGKDHLGRSKFDSRSPLGLRELKQRCHRSQRHRPQVAALLGCVNWNDTEHNMILPELVAALLGCVNWNPLVTLWSMIEPSRSPFGLRELKRQVPAFRVHHRRRSRLGCVNWNINGEVAQVRTSLSQPAWAAWIETSSTPSPVQRATVAARLGCVNQR